MRVAPLREFLTEQIRRAQDDDVLFSVHLKATMMKVSDPIIFGHVVRAFFPGLFAEYGEQARRRRTLAERRPGRHPGRRRVDGRRGGQGGHPRRDPGRVRRGPTARDGRLRPRHHQPPRAQRRDRRRLDAGDDPHQWPHVGTRRPGGRHPGGDPGLVVRRDLPGRHRRLPRPRCLRPGHDGVGPERRPDGAGRRGVRLPRQDLRDPGHGAGAGGRRERTPSCSSTPSPPATSGVPARPRTSRSATGSGSPSSGRAPPAYPRSSGSTPAGPTTRT